MAPMIDMVFLLLVFFMTVSTLAKDARPELSLAVSFTAAVPEEAPPREVLTVIPDKAGYLWYWHNRVVDSGQLTKLLDKSGDGESLEILLRGSPDLPWKAWKELLPLCREHGASDLVFSTYED
jgi:biopolymer transport protein ExbD